MKPSGRNLNLTSYDEIFQTEETRIEATQEKVIDIPLTDLHPFKNHPFKVTDDESMLETAEVVAARYGISPFLVRLVFVLLLLPGGIPGLLPYLLLMFLMPKAY